jgi:uroporphyrinogen decarboxylase
MNQFTPDYQNIVLAARNKVAPRIPLYEHGISIGIMERITGQSFGSQFHGDFDDKCNFMRHYADFFRSMGYDTITFEQCIGPAMPGSGALGRHIQGVIRDRADFERYPWKEIPEMYFTAFAKNFDALHLVMPQGMKAIGGVGNGIFECVQDLVGYTDLCYLAVDDPDLYADLFKRMGDVSLAIWTSFMKRYADDFCVLRFGDDLGFKSTTLLSASDIRQHILPQYKRIVDLVHSYGKPFLLHSCGAIFDVMEDLISFVGIDAKHSNEDQIAPFTTWFDCYGDRIGNFGGIDMDNLCQKSESEVRTLVRDVMDASNGHGGFALGSGNSIPDYVPISGYLSMVEACREYRGDMRAH